MSSVFWRSFIAADAARRVPRGAYLEARYSKKRASASVERSRSLRSTLSSSECALEKGSPAPVRSSVAFGKALAKSATKGIVPPAPRSEERRVGKECRARGSGG